MERISDMKLAGLIEKLDLKLTPRFEEGEFDHLHMALRELYMYRAAAPLEKVQERAKAFEEGMAVVLPCKIGDTLWRVVSSLSNRGKTYWYLQPVKLKPHNLYKIVFGEEVGKTVFFTREEAQAALEAKNRGDQ